MGFDASLEMSGSIAKITLSGELDATTAQAFRSVIQEAAEKQCRPDGSGISCEAWGTLGSNIRVRPQSILAGSLSSAETSLLRGLAHGVPRKHV